MSARFSFRRGRVAVRSLRIGLGHDAIPRRIWLADDGSNDESAAVLRRHYGLAPPALDAASAAPLAYPYWHQEGFRERNPAPV